MPDLSSPQRVLHASRFDGRTRVILIRRLGGDWERVHGRLRLTRTNVRRLREERVAELEVRRWFLRARIPMDWFGSGTSS